MRVTPFDVMRPCRLRIQVRVIGGSPPGFDECCLPPGAIGDSVQQPPVVFHVVGRRGRPAPEPAGRCRNPECLNDPVLAVGAVVGQRLARPLARGQDAAPAVAEVFAAVGFAFAGAGDQAGRAFLGWMPYRSQLAHRGEQARIAAPRRAVPRVPVRVGLANGSGLVSWAICSPVTILRIRWSPLPWMPRENPGRPEVAAPAAPPSFACTSGRAVASSACTVCSRSHSREPLHLVTSSREPHIPASITSPPGRGSCQAVATDRQVRQRAIVLPEDVAERLGVDPKP